MTKLARFLQRYWPFVFTFTIILLIIEYAVALDWIPAFIIPKPTDVMGTITEQADRIWEHTQTTLWEVIIGLIFSIGLGCLIGIGLHYSKILERALYPFILISQTIPTVALSPIFILWFGYSLWTKVAIIFLITFFPVVVSVYDGLKLTDPEYIELFRVMGANPWQIFKDLKWRMALPSIYSGLKMTVVYSLMGAVVGEWLGGNAGLGYYIRRMSSSLKSEGVFAGILVLSLIGILMFYAVTYLEHRSLYYLQKESERSL